MYNIFLHLLHLLHFCLFTTTGDFPGIRLKVLIFHFILLEYCLIMSFSLYYPNIIVVKFHIY